MVRPKFLSLAGCLRNCIRKTKLADTGIIVRTDRTAIQNGFMFIIRYEQKQEWKLLTNITENSSTFIGGEMNQLIT